MLVHFFLFLSGLDGNDSILLRILLQHKTVYTNRALQHATRLFISRLCCFTCQFDSHGAHVSCFTCQFDSHGAHVSLLTCQFNSHGAHVSLFTCQFDSHGAHVSCFTCQFDSHGAYVIFFLSV